MSGILGNQHIRVVPLVAKASLKTKLWDVEATRSGNVLGRIKWYAHWRQYVFAPADGCLFNPECLRSIATFVEFQTVEHRNPVLRP